MRVAGRGGDGGGVGGGGFRLYLDCSIVMWILYCGGVKSISPRANDHRTNSKPRNHKSLLPLRLPTTLHLLRHWIRIPPIL